jgi:CII-binding regulator of phage lambda lysogenization HflD
MDLGDTLGAVFGKEGDLRETVQGALGGLENLTKKIPGYKGYKDKELRREADKLLRMEVADKLDDQRKRLTELQNRLISQAQIEFLDDLERAVMKLQLLIDRIKTASYGYAGLFDAIKVKEEQLDALYEFDNKMLDFVGEIAADVDRVASAISAKEGIGDAITDLVDTAEQANLTFGHRDEAILQASSYEDL